MKRPQFRHYQELAELRLFFEKWYGVRWEAHVMQDAGVYRGEIGGAQRGHKSFSDELLPKLRKLKMRLDVKSGCF